MNLAVVEVERHADGKLYPARWPVPHEDAERVRILVHQLRCRDQLSYRLVQRELAERHGIRRSRGRIYAIIANFECGRCERG